MSTTELELLSMGATRYEPIKSHELSMRLNRDGPAVQG
jgi:hypothetical protein